MAVMSSTDDCSIAFDDAFDATDLAIYLKDHGFSESVCSEFEENDIDGSVFLELSLDELNKLVPKKIGTVKKLYRLIQSLLSRSVETPKSPSNSILAPSSRELSPSEKSTTASVASSFPSAAANLKATEMKIPDTWRPSIMEAINAKTEAEGRRLLSTDVRNAIIRDLVTTMYAHTSKPNAKLCKKIAEKLVKKYPFMKDAGKNVSGHGSWEKKLIERVHNVAKPGKKRDSEALGQAEQPPAKRGRPKGDPLLSRYPIMTLSEDSEDNEADQEALNDELERTPPSRELVLSLLKRTFSSRRPSIIDRSSNNVAIKELVMTHKAFKYSYAIEQEIDLILSKRDVVKTGGREWSNKWTPAICAYLAAKPGKLARTIREDGMDKFKGDDVCVDEKLALFFLLALFGKKENISWIYEEFEIAEDPEEVAARSPVPAPRIVAFIGPDPSNTVTYYLFIEQMVLCGLPGYDFGKCLLAWFCAHYIFHLGYAAKIHEVALFVQEFVVGLPESTSRGKTKKSSTYLTICSDIQSYSVL